MQLLVWNARAKNPWLTLAMEACDRVLPPLATGTATCGPGPFSMSDPATLCTMLRASGLTGIELHCFHEPIFLGADVERAIDFQLALGPAGERMRAAGALGTVAENAIRDELRRLFGGYHRAGGVWLPSSVWYVSGLA
jgi:hypothetical protein